MHEITDEKLSRELRAALDARAMSVETGDAVQRVSLARSRAARRRRLRPSTIAGLAAAVMVALMGGIGIAAWHARTQGGLPGASASPSQTPAADLSSVPTPDVTPTATSTPGPTDTPASTLPLSPGFHAAASMITVQPISARLAGGRVLFVDSDGWVNGGSPVALLYDPGTGQFLRTGSLPMALGSQTVTPLLDGRALVAGGFDYDDNMVELAAAELFDPATGRFASTGSMGSKRVWHTATLLDDGRVLVAGGDDAFSGQALASAELYDPDTGRFTPAGSLSGPRFDHTATLLADGRVLLFGGCDETGCSSDSGVGCVATAEIYDPATDTFTPTGSAATGRCGHTATRLADGRVLVTGGVSGGKILSSAEIYDPMTGEFTSAGSMSIGRERQTATLLSDGRVLVAGGLSGPTAGDGPNANPSGQPSAVASAELFDPRTGKFEPAGTMTQPRGGHTATLLPGGQVLIAGGYASRLSPFAADQLNWIPVTVAEIYQP
jgi:hypothetical protein